MPEMPQLAPISTAPLSVILLHRPTIPDSAELVAGWITYLNGLDRPYEVVLVHEGKSEPLQALAERHPHLRLAQPDLPRGEGSSLATGLAATTMPLVCYARLDPRYRPSDLRKLLAEIDKVHLVSGYRAGWPMPWAWRVVGLFYRFLCRLVLGQAPAPLPGYLGLPRHLGQVLCRVFFAVRNQDVGCPFRLLRREMLTHLPLQSHGSFVHAELLAKASFLGHLLAEDVPLGDRQHPVEPEAEFIEPAKKILADFYRMLNRPDFGPPPSREPVPALPPTDAPLQ